MFFQVAYGIIGERRVVSEGSYIPIWNHAYMRWREERLIRGRNLEGEGNDLLGAGLLTGCMSESVWAAITKYYRLGSL